MPGGEQINPRYLQRSASAMRSASFVSRTPRHVIPQDIVFPPGVSRPPATARGQCSPISSSPPRPPSHFSFFSSSSCLSQKCPTNRRSVWGGVVALVAAAAGAEQRDSSGGTIRAVLYLCPLLLASLLLCVTGALPVASLCVLLLLQVWNNETALVARCRKVYSNAHAYHINSISVNRYCTFIVCGSLYMVPMIVLQNTGSLTEQWYSISVNRYNYICFLTLSFGAVFVFISSSFFFSRL